MLRALTTGVAILCLPASLPAAERVEAPRASGEVQFEPIGDPKSIPERYRLEAHSFAFEMDLKYPLPGCDIDVWRLRFPSPVTTPHPENNTVHAEYYRPRREGRFPCVIVLDITGGDQSVSRMIATRLAQEGVGGLFVQMAYYGPRRPKGSKLRLLSTDVNHSLAAVRQTVLDMRRATAWMALRPEIDPKRLGILGTSLGSFMGSLTAEMEPRLGRVGILLGGGGLVDAYYDDPRGAVVRRVWELTGGTKKKLADMLAPVDPITCASNLRDRKVLLLAAKHDDIVPPRMAEAMWEATGKQKIVWFDCNHVGAVVYVVPALRHIVDHFGAE